MDLELRPIGPEEYEMWQRRIYRAFGGHVTDLFLNASRSSVDVDRTVAAFDDGDIVGTTFSHRLEMTTPGGSAVVATIDDVTVQPTHRRRGILTRMMERQLRGFHEREEPLAALRASESVIYGRFGFGVGALREDWTIERQYTAFARPHERTAHIRFLDKAEALAVYPGVTDRAFEGRPGYVKGNESLWELYLSDFDRGIENPYGLFFVVYEEDGRVDGYASYRIEDGTLKVRDMATVTEAAHASLWRHCFDVDLVSSTEAERRPVDDPLPWMLADPRRLKRTVYDDLWLRLVDVRVALASRRYAQIGRLVIELSDLVCPWNEGSFELDGGPDRAECLPTDAEPDLALSAGDLAAAYLGGVRFSTLARAGRVEERTQGALRLADSMFATVLQPWFPEHVYLP